MNCANLPFSAVVLAGGKSSRFWRDKTAETLGGRSLLERVLARLHGFATETIVVLGAGQTAPSAALAGCRFVSDIFPGKGPLGGIYAGLEASRTDWNIVVAADMPFLNLALLRYIVSSGAGADAVLPRLGDLIEPLHAAYSRSCLPAIEGIIRRDGVSVRDLFPLVTVREIGPEEIDRFDPEHLSFFNINTRSDWLRAAALVEEQPRAC